ncbi:hypothetical protein [Vulgatibacter incomptus]|uniref:Uncharacterized protein n=1 Tax=Vulgatibacter incomptus TaxID=1391653 RepID=A0A0K1PG91_9BACT|nr:hypothetical protein [Vulgatibacter incomptus]AKU92535.1 hypothetical protein AKJ08_2922 [Vulgatibacter incomptus]
MELRLGRPEGIVPIQIIGGMECLRIARPKDVPVSIRMFGGAESVHADNLRLDSVGGIFRYGDVKGGDGTGRFEVQVIGGVENFEVAGSEPAHSQVA